MNSLDRNNHGGADGADVSGTGISREHWLCRECGTFDGPRAATFCDVCADGSTVEWLVPHGLVLSAVFDALSHMDPDTAQRWRGERSYQRLAEALRQPAPVSERMTSSAEPQRPEGAPQP